MYVCVGIYMSCSRLLPKGAHLSKVDYLYTLFIPIRPLGEEEVIPLLDRISERGKTIGKCIQRSQKFLLNCIPKIPRQIKELGPDLIELQAEIDTIR